jgi:hypothetical protein
MPIEVIVPPPTDDQVAELETKFKRLGRIRHDRGAYEVVFRRPTRVEFRSFREKIHNPARKAAAQEELARLLVVYPTREKFDELLEEYPALCDGEAVSDLLKRMMDGASEADGK